jgi:hypothetical protein
MASDEGALAGAKDADSQREVPIEAKVQGVETPLLRGEIAASDVTRHLAEGGALERSVGHVVAQRRETVRVFLLPVTAATAAAAAVAAWTAAFKGAQLSDHLSDNAIGRRIGLDGRRGEEVSARGGFLFESREPLLERDVVHLGRKQYRRETVEQVVGCLMDRDVHENVLRDRADLRGSEQSMLSVG